MAVLVALDEAEHQVPNVEGPTPHPMAMVPAQCLLVLGQAEELIHRVLEGCLASLLIVHTDLGAP